MHGVTRAKAELRGVGEDRRLAASEAGGGCPATQDDGYAAGAGAPLCHVWLSPANGEETAPSCRSRCCRNGADTMYAHPSMRLGEFKRRINLIVLAITVVVGVSVTIAHDKVHKHLPGWEKEQRRGVWHQCSWTVHSGNGKAGPVTAQPATWAWRATA